MTNLDKHIDTDSLLYKQLSKQGKLAALNSDGSVAIVDREVGGTGTANANKRPVVFIRLKKTSKGDLAVLSDIPPNTPPGAVIYVSYGITSADPHLTKYAFYYKEKFPKKKKPKKKPKPKPPETIRDLFKGRQGKFNPPPHNVSRPISPTAFSGYQLSDSANVSVIADLQKANKRGYIIEDIETAIDNKGKPKTKVSQLWGFEFMYNPETFTHSVGASPYEIGNAEDTAVGLTGAQKLSLSLLINRVVDIPALKTFWLEKQDVVTPFTGRDPDYPRPITVEDVEGIIKRGTEYDIDFLYRVLNGDPVLGPTASIPISDFGYLTQSPVWLYINEDFRYKVIITDISVSHYMFTEDMIPVMTNLTLSMFRIPDPSYGSVEEDDTFIYDRYTVDDGQGGRIAKNPTWGPPADTNSATTTPGTGSGWGSRNP